MYGFTEQPWSIVFYHNSLGSLFEFRTLPRKRQRGGYFSKRTMISLLKDVLFGMYHLHCLGFVHFDIRVRQDVSSSAELTL
jgi:hypothetical protein